MEICGKWCILYCPLTICQSVSQYLVIMLFMWCVKQWLTQCCSVVEMVGWFVESHHVLSPVFPKHLKAPSSSLFQLTHIFWHPVWFFPTYFLCFHWIIYFYIPIDQDTPAHWFRMKAFDLAANFGTKNLFFLILQLIYITILFYIIVLVWNIFS